MNASYRCFLALSLFALTAHANEEDDLDSVSSSDKAELPGQVISDADLRKAPYERVTPHWGYQLGFAPKVFQRGNAFPSEYDKHPSSVQLSGEWLPLNTDKYGMIGVGAVGSFYGYTSAPSKSGTKPSGFPGWSAGSIARYQLKYLQNQWIVPSIGYRLESFHYRNSLNQMTSMVASGPTLGLSFLLNTIDPWSTATLYTDSGIVRSYLTAEALGLRGSSSDFSLSGTTYLFGLRFEL